MTCLVFKTTYIDRGKPLREGAFSFARRTLFPVLDKKKRGGERAVIAGRFYDENPAEFTRFY